MGQPIVEAGLAAVQTTARERRRRSLTPEPEPEVEPHPEQEAGPEPSDSELALGHEDGGRFWQQRYPKAMQPLQALQPRPQHPEPEMDLPVSMEPEPEQPPPPPQAQYVEASPVSERGSTEVHSLTRPTTPATPACWCRTCLCEPFQSRSLLTHSDFECSR